MGTKTATLAKTIARLTMSVEIDPHTECWNWKGRVGDDGYGTTSAFIWDEPFIRAHCLSYRLFVGEIPEGHDVHHDCRNIICCNPAHMKTKPHRSHSLEHVAERLAKLPTICGFGHRFTPENTGYQKNTHGTGRKRYCKECAHDRYLVRKNRLFRSASASA